MRNFFTGIFLTLLVIGIAVFLMVKKGYMDFNADQEPSLLESKLAMQAVDSSTDRHAPDVKNPIAANDENLAAGAKLYIGHCAGCHGVPSNPDSQLGRSFYPTVPAFFRDSPDMPDNQNYYIIQHGIRLSGMPAWEQFLSDRQIWQVTGFLSHMDKLPPEVSSQWKAAAGASAGASSTPDSSLMDKQMHMK